MNSDLNKQLADFNISSTQKKSKVGGSRLNADIDDSRSDYSYISNQSYVAPSSHFSSALKKNAGFTRSNIQNQLLNASQMSHDMSSSVSQVSYEDGYPNAEHMAIDEEERARRRTDEKQRKLKDFQKQTQINANKKIKQEIAAKEKEQQEKLIKEKERLSKAKEYAKKQRDIIGGKTMKKTGKVEILSQSTEQDNSINDPAGQHTNYHSQFKYENNKDLSEVIPEVTEADEKMSQFNEESKVEEVPQTNETNLMDLFQRIDQEELEKIGVSNKQDVSEQALVELHQYSMLQRFRNNKDFKVVDKYKPKTKANNKQFDNQDKENKWWQTNQQENTVNQKQKLEKQRYLKALKALVYEKGDKGEGREIPSLCSCGAVSENLKQMNKGKDIQQMCASNCQFYKHPKDYEKALGDILYSIQQFK